MRLKSQSQLKYLKTLVFVIIFTVFITLTGFSEAEVKAEDNAAITENHYIYNTNAVNSYVKLDALICANTVPYRMISVLEFRNGNPKQKALPSVMHKITAKYPSFLLTSRFADMWAWEVHLTNSFLSDIYLADNFHDFSDVNLYGANNPPFQNSPSKDDGENDLVDVSGNLNSNNQGGSGSSLEAVTGNSQAPQQGERPEIKPESKPESKPETKPEIKPEIPTKPQEKPPVPDSGNKPGGGAGTTQPAFAEQIVNLVNEERKKAGLGELTLDKTIEAAALLRAKETEISFSHTRPDGSPFHTALTQNGVKYRGSGENIAWGQKTPEAVMSAWMNSPGHKANILKLEYKKIGVGHYQNSSGVSYWTQLFTY